MKFKTKFLQEGGQVAPPQEAPQEQGQPQGGGPEEQIMQVAQQLMQQLGPEACTMLIQVLGQMLQGAAEQPQQPQPQFQKKGGRLVKIN